MKTTTLHGHNSAREAREVFNDNRLGISVYRVNAGFIASFWLRRDGPIYAEATFPTQREAEAAARELVRQEAA